MEIAKIPTLAKYTFSSFYANHGSGTFDTSYALSIPMAQPFKDVSGVRTYPPLYADLTDIWGRYRVTSITVTITVFPTSAGTAPIFVTGHPYRGSSSAANSLSALNALPMSKCVASPVGYGRPIIFKQTISLQEAYKLLSDSTEDGIEGPSTWAAATH